MFTPPSPLDRRGHYFYVGLLCGRGHFGPAHWRMANDSRRHRVYGVAALLPLACPWEKVLSLGHLQQLLAAGLDLAAARLGESVRREGLNRQACHGGTVEHGLAERGEVGLTGGGDVAQ